MSKLEGKRQKAQVRNELTPAIHPEASRWWTSASAFLTCALCLLPWAFASDAEAALVKFSTGAVMSVESCHIKDDTATIALRGGGQLIVPKSAIAEVLPD